MRARLLDATIACLAERGYGAMSTNDVVRRARVSRGALAHHFPTKADLVSAAAERLLDERAAQFRRHFGAIAPSRRTPAEALTVLWSFYDDDPGCLALIELIVAARTRPELRAVLADTPGRINELTREVFAEFFPQLAGLPFVDVALRTVHLVFAGLALDAIVDRDAAAASLEVRTVLQALAANLESSAPTRRTT